MSVLDAQRRPSGWHRAHCSPHYHLPRRAEVDWLIPELGWRGCNLVSTLLIQAKEPKRLGEYLVDCAAEGRAEERDLFGARAVLQTLAAAKVREWGAAPWAVGSGLADLDVLQVCCLLERSFPARRRPSRRGARWPCMPGSSWRRLTGRGSSGSARRPWTRPWADSARCSSRCARGLEAVLLAAAMRGPVWGGTGRGVTAPLLW